MSKAKHASTTSKSRRRSPPRSSSPEKQRPLLQMPFVKPVKNSRSQLYPYDFWAVAETGNGYLDNELGEALADKFINAIGREGPSGAMNDLELIVGSIAKKGADFCPHVRIGFLCRLTHRLIVIYRHP